MLKLINIFKDYKIGSEREPVLKGINLDIRQGEFVSIVGASGCGKTTLLNVIAGIDHYSQGEIRHLSRSTIKYNDNDWSYMRKCQIGYIFQNFNLIDHLTAMENVELALKFGGVRRHNRKKRAKELLETVGLGNRCKHLPSQLSGGQKQRVAIARALANNPSLILADEPTGALDSITSKEILELLKRINKEKGCTIIMITHSIDLADQADRKITMSDGKIINDKMLNSDNNKSIQSDKDNIKNMAILSAVSIALKNISNRKKRTTLTAIGTAIGILGVLLLLGIGNGAKNRVYKEISPFIDNNSIYVTSEKNVMDASSKAAITNIENVKSMADDFSFNVTYEYNETIGTTLGSSLQPLENKDDGLSNLVSVGSLPSADDSSEIVISKSMAQKLAGEDRDYKSIIGKKMMLLFSLDDSSILTYQIKCEYTICGLSDNDIFGTDVIDVPYLTSLDLAKQSAEDNNYISKNYVVTVKDKKKIGTTKDNITAMGFDATTDQDGIKKLNSYLDMITAVLILISSVAVVVSAIMITLVMYMSVMEQIRAIGVMRAIGSRKKDIHRIFIAEGGTIGFFSGIIGIILAGLIGAAINAVLNAVFPSIGFNLYQISPLQIIYCISFSILLSILASFLPARKASRMDPVIALGFFQ